MQVHSTTLALELSQRLGSIAMMNKEGTVASRTVESGRRDEDELFPEIESVATELHISPVDIELVVVSIGPGGFTGLRTSVAIAKMVALAAHAEIVPVESAIVTAVSSNAGEGPFLVASCVKRNQCWLSRVEKINNRWECEASMTPIDAVQSKTNGVSTIFADEFLNHKTRDRIEEHGVKVVPNNVDVNALLEVGLEMFNRGERCDPASLLPLYPGQPEAVRVWKERQIPPM